jgi:hypothetical protein
MGMGQTAQPLWASAAALQERIAPLLDADGDAREAAVYRMSAASCYEKAGDPSRAANLYQSALAGPLRSVTRKEVEALLAACLARLKAESCRFASKSEPFLSLGRPGPSARLRLPAVTQVMSVAFLPPETNQGGRASKWLTQVKEMAQSQMQIDRVGTPAVAPRCYGIVNRVEKGCSRQEASQAKTSPFGNGAS